VNIVTDCVLGGTCAATAIVCGIIGTFTPDPPFGLGLVSMAILPVSAFFVVRAAIGLYRRGRVHG
jgi:hypothetical protein